MFLSSFIGWLVGPLLRNVERTIIFMLLLLHRNLAVHGVFVHIDHIEYISFVIYLRLFLMIILSSIEFVEACIRKIITILL